MFDIITFIIIVLCVGIIVYIIGRKFPELRLLNIESIPEVKESGVKKKILETRWKRNISHFKSMAAPMAKFLFGTFVNIVRGIYRKVLELERYYTQQAQKQKDAHGDLPPLLENYIIQAKDLQGKGEVRGAEEFYIKALEIDDRNIDAYLGLGEVYREKKDYANARDTYIFLTKLLSIYRKGDDMDKRRLLATCFAILGEIDEALENKDAALKYYRKAVFIEPNNPRFLDLLLHFSIIIRDKKLAKRTLQQLIQANSDNQKIKELKKTVEEIDAPKEQI